MCEGFEMQAEAGEVQLSCFANDSFSQIVYVVCWECQLMWIVLETFRDN